MHFGVDATGGGVYHNRLTRKPNSGRVSRFEVRGFSAPIPERLSRFMVHCPILETMNRFFEHSKL